jgi:hypothetical protein
MKKNHFLAAGLTALLMAAIVVSCYKITLVEQDHEALTNSTFKGKVVVKRDGSTDQGFVMHVYGLFGICVPEGWQAEGDLVMTQVPLSTTNLGDAEYSQTITRQLVAHEAYSALLNDTYPKTGYTWLGFVTDEPFKSMFNSKTPEDEVDSIYVDFTIRTNDKTGSFYLDYIAGQCEKDKLSEVGTKLDGWYVKTATFKGQDIGNVIYSNTHVFVTRPDGTIGDDAFVDPVSVKEWKLEYLPEGSRPGGCMAYKDKKYDKLFTRSYGWNGGDGVFTVGLPNGDVFWTFNDSFYGTVAASNRARKDCSFPRNSIMVQRAHDGIPGESSKDFVWLADYVNWTNPSESTYMNARTHLRHPEGECTDEEIAAGKIDQGKVYWSGDGRIYNGKLQMLWFGVQAEELRNLSSALATYSLEGNIPTGYYRSSIPDYLPHEGDYLYRESVTHQINENAVSYGSTLWEDEDGHNYLYATIDYKPVVGRTATEDLYSEWEYYVKDAEGDGWHWQPNYPTEDEMKRSSIMANGYSGSLPWVFKDGEWYYMTMQDPYFSREVHIYRSKSPVGPFTDQKLLIMLPDHIDKIGNQKYHWLYMVNLHPALSRGGELVFTTNTDPEDFWDNFNAAGSADYYRPYFYRVYNWKSLYGLPNDNTAINKPKTTDRPAPRSNDPAYYTLQGVRTLSPGQGVYIHQGRKVVVK